MSNEWIEHDGKALPTLDIWTTVEVRFRDGGSSFNILTVEFWGVNWIHDPDYSDENDIVAYRVVTP